MKTLISLIKTKTIILVLLFVFAMSSQSFATANSASLSSILKIEWLIPISFVILLILFLFSAFVKQKNH